MSVTRINRFVAKKGSEDILHALLASILPLVEQSEGCEAVSLLRDTSSPGEMVIIERWRDEAAHMASAQNVPAEKFTEVMALLNGPPQGAYYQ